MNDFGKTLRKLFILALLLCPSWAEPNLKRVTFYTVPEDAQVYLEVGTADPYLLGRAGEELPLDLSLFNGRRNVRVSFRRAGWLDEIRVLQQEPIQSRYFDTRDRYPERNQGPVRLSPRTDWDGRKSQLSYYLQRFGWVIGGLFGVTALGLVIGWRRRKESMRRRERSTKLESMVATLDQSDSYAGRVLGGYRLMEQIGAGGMSLVYRAVDNESLDKEVAVKLLDPKVAGNPDSIKRFRREIQICRSLIHPHILQLYDFGEHEGLWYLVLELLKGHTLSAELDKGVLDCAQAKRFIEPIVEALEYLHGQGVVHRDLKPENVFVTDRGQVKLMDFGIARGSQFTVATATHQGLGTPAYMSPEQVEGEFSEASDQYALGCVIYEMFSGVPPFQDPDPFALAFKHVGESPEPLGDRNPEVTPDVEGAVMKLLAKRPEQRYASIREAGLALFEVLDDR